MEVQFNCLFGVVLATGGTWSPLELELKVVIMAMWWSMGRKTLH